ncbi:response regulator [Thalassotalea sp. 1_MG-2023]|uniref:response regulator n=1 Tax=Thalassotalea sp. 1_MG-2023 TaxID=3062680 RepID=UPI0026E39022|nr:response regulator [Thalassotalea sp. 1_MG-2023]MDO6425771.1 response regulator [Thalassotalea sp. 1_MG-2023]
MRKLVLIEDDDDDIYFFKLACQQVTLDIELTVLRNGLEFIDYVQKNTVLNTVFLLDLNMPKLSGFEALKKISNHPEFNQMVVIIYTTSSRDKDMKFAYELGVKSYLLKPNSMLGIQKLLNNVTQYWFEVNAFSEKAS